MPSHGWRPSGRHASWTRRAVAHRVAGLVLCALVPLLAAAELPRDTPDEAELRFSQLLNGHRNARGCAPLEWSDEIAAVARAHSRDMWRRDFFQHDSPEGQSVDDRLRTAGVLHRGGASENLALGQPDAEGVLRLWLGSPPHRKNLQNCRHTHFGIGRHNDLWTYVAVAKP